MRRGLAAAGIGALLGVALLSAPASAAEPRKSRSLTSVNTLWSLQMIEPEPGACRLEATKDQQVVWTLEKCVGTADDLYFIANDGQRFWVLKVLPQKPDAPKKSVKKVPSKAVLSKLVVAVEHDASGEVLQQRTLGQFIPKAKYGELKHLTKHVRWLQGAAGERGVGPRLTSAGRVEFETVVGQTHSLPLEKTQE